MTLGTLFLEITLIHLKIYKALDISLRAKTFLFLFNSTFHTLPKPPLPMTLLYSKMLRLKTFFCWYRIWFSFFSKFEQIRLCDYSLDFCLTGEDWREFLFDWIEIKPCLQLKIHLLSEFIQQRIFEWVPDALLHVAFLSLCKDNSFFREIRVLVFLLLLPQLLIRLILIFEGEFVLILFAWVSERSTNRVAIRIVACIACVAITWKKFKAIIIIHDFLLLL